MMTQSEYKAELKAIGKRFDGQINDARKERDKWAATRQKEQKRFDKWLESYQPNYPFTMGMVQRQHQYDADVGQQRQALNQAIAAERAAADKLATFEANKASWIKKLNSRYETAVVEAARETAMAAVASVVRS
jgi:hypothetical protein